MRAIIIVDKNIGLTVEQKETLNRFYPKQQIMEVPIDGWSYNDILKITEELKEKLDVGFDIVFVANIPVMLMFLASYVSSCYTNGSVHLFHCDKSISIFI